MAKIVCVMNAVAKIVAKTAGVMTAFVAVVMMMGVDVVVVVTVVAMKDVMVVDIKTAVVVMMMTGVKMVGVAVTVSPLVMLTPLAKFATFMATLRRTVGGVMEMIVVTMKIVDTRMQILLLMELTQTGIMIQVLLTILLVS